MHVPVRVHCISFFSEIFPRGKLRAHTGWDVSRPPGTRTRCQQPLAKASQRGNKYRTANLDVKPSPWLVLPCPKLRSCLVRVVIFSFLQTITLKLFLYIVLVSTAAICRDPRSRWGSFASAAWPSLSAVAEKKINVFIKTFVDICKNAEAKDHIQTKAV